MTLCLCTVAKESASVSPPVSFYYFLSALFLCFFFAFYEQFCSFVAGADKCLEQIEVTYCAVMCAPDSERFLKVTADGKNGTLYVCDEFAQTLYDACKGLEVLGLPSTLGQLIPNPSVRFCKTEKIKGINLAYLR